MTDQNDVPQEQLVVAVPPASTPSAPQASAAPSPMNPPAPDWVYSTWEKQGDQPFVGSKGSSTKVAVLAGVLSGLLAGFGSFAAVEFAGIGNNAPIKLPAASGDTSPRPDDSIAGLAKTVLPTVVSIEVKSATASGTGSGFVIKSDSTSSFILTNNHVASGAGEGAEITVNLSDQSTVSATVVGTDASYDLAVLKVEQGNLPVAALGNSDDVVVGDAVIAIGSPLGLTGTVTSGIVSALNRPVTAGDQNESSFINAIQTDAAINPGNSGGPLINSKGQVIGINSAIASLGQSLGGQSGSIGLGFSIPINQAKRVAEELINSGKSSHPVIGVTIDMTYTGKGAQIQEIAPNGPAAKTELKPGDIVTAIDGIKVADGTELIVRIRSHVPGDTVTLSRENGTDVKIVLAKNE
jgi:putative serine protease PepD